MKVVLLSLSILFLILSSGCKAEKISLSVLPGASSKLESGVAPATLAISDGPTFDFGSQPTGSVVLKTLTVTNSGNVTATAMSGSTLAAPFNFKDGAYPGTGGNCTATLIASGSCTIVIAYSPTTLVTSNASVTVNYNNGVTGQSSSRPVQGTGVNPALLSIDGTNPTDFLNISTGSFSDITITLTNSGNFLASSISLSGLVAPFSTIGGSCGTTLAPAATCTIILRFSPSLAGSFSNTLSISYFNGASTITISRNLIGKSVPELLSPWGSGTTYSMPNFPNTKRVMFVVVSFDDNATRDVTVLSYGDQAMTQAFEFEKSDGTRFTKVEIWYLKENEINLASSTLIQPTWLGNIPPAVVVFGNATFKNLDQGPTTINSTNAATSLDATVPTATAPINSSGLAICGAGLGGLAASTYSFNSANFITGNVYNIGTPNPFSTISGHGFFISAGSATCTTSGFTPGPYRQVNALVTVNPN